MTQDKLKKSSAEAALEYVESGMIVGVGTGSTANYFIDGLAGIKRKLDGTVASSEASAERLRGHGIPVMDLNSAGELQLYVDGADETTRFLHLIKGGGGALTREKIVAAASEKFVCIADDSKLVDVLGTLDECRFTYKGIPVSKEIARIYYRNTPWYQAVEEAKEEDRMRWKELVKESPDPLPERLRALISMVYAACTNEITGREWFKDIPPVEEILREIKDVLSNRMTIA